MRTLYVGLAIFTLLVQRINVVADDTRQQAQSLKDKDPQKRIQALYELANRNSIKHVKEIAALLNDPEPTVISAALYAVGRLGAIGCIKEVAQLLKHNSSPEIRGNAAKALGELDAREYEKNIAAMLGERHYSIQNGCLEALGMFGSKEHVKEMAKLVRPSNLDPTLLKTLIKLQCLNDIPDIKNYIKEFLKDRNDYNVALGIDALASLGNKEDASLVEPLLPDKISDHTKDASTIAAFNFLASIKTTNKEHIKKIANQLQVLSHHRRAGVIYTSVITLAELNAQDHIKDIVALLKNREYAVCAVAALGMLGDKKYINNIIETMNKYPDTSTAGYISLALLGCKDKVKQMVNKLSDNNAAPAVLWALGKLKESGHTKSILKTLKNDDPQIIGNAIWAIGQIGTIEAKKEIEKFLNDPRFCSIYNDTDFKYQSFRIKELAKKAIDTLNR